MTPRRAQNTIAKLRGHRIRGPRVGLVADQVAALEQDLSRRFKSIGEVAAAWSRLVPAELCRSAELVSMSRGVLTVRVQDAAARYGLDRFLRSGGERELQRQSPVTLKKIKLVG